MGRRTVAVTDERRWVFNRLAESYAARPSYPDAVVEHLVRLAGVRGRVVDLGAGTGALALPLAAKGLSVCAVEPASRMLEVLDASAGALGLRVQTLHAAAESTSLPGNGFDLAVVADAVHWLDPELAGAEISRLLDDGGGCAVVEVHLADTPFLRALKARLRAANPKVSTPSPLRASQLLSIAVPRASRREVARFAVSEVLDDDRFRSTLRSLSYVGPAVGPHVLDEVLEDASALARQFGGAQWSREIAISYAGR